MTGPDIVPIRTHPGKAAGVILRPRFAGIWTNWTSVRKVKEGETTNDIFAFLTIEPNAEVGAIHPKAMPVILTTIRGRDLDDRPSGRGPMPMLRGKPI